MTYSPILQQIRLIKGKQGSKGPTSDFTEGILFWRDGHLINLTLREALKYISSVAYQCQMKGTPTHVPIPDSTSQ